MFCYEWNYIYDKIMIIPGYGEGTEDQEEENESFFPFSRVRFSVSLNPKPHEKLEKLFLLPFCATFLTDSFRSWKDPPRLRNP